VAAKDDFLDVSARASEPVRRCDVGRSARQWAASLRTESEQGQTMAEYATLLGILVVAVVATITVFSTAVNGALASHVTTILTGF
jgi:Flp pilus assembly pilin Flp